MKKLSKPHIRFKSGPHHTISSLALFVLLLLIFCIVFVGFLLAIGHSLYSSTATMSIIAYAQVCNAAFICGLTSILGQIHTAKMFFLKCRGITAILVGTIVIALFIIQLNILLWDYSPILDYILSIFVNVPLSLLFWRIGLEANNNPPAQQ